MKILYFIAVVLIIGGFIGALHIGGMFMRAESQYRQEGGAK